jgi:hypothetical protein
MTDTVTPTVDDFLRQYEAADAGPNGEAASPAAAGKLQQWVQAHPAAALNLVREAQEAQAQLQAVRRERVRQERAWRMGVPTGPTSEQLARQSQAWDKLLGTRNGHRPQPAAAGAGGPAPAKRLTIEDIGARFAHAHVGKAWLALLVAAAIVVALR